jgi:hypothetical protein
VNHNAFVDKHDLSGFEYFVRDTQRVSDRDSFGLIAGFPLSKRVKCQAQFDLLYCSWDAIGEVTALASQEREDVESLSDLRAPDNPVAHG